MDGEQMREVVGGINWVWYHTDTREEAETWFKELTGSEPVTRTPAGAHDDKYPSLEQGGLRSSFLLQPRLSLSRTAWWLPTSWPPASVVQERAATAKTRYSLGSAELSPAAKTRLWLAKTAQRPLKRGAATVVQRPRPRG